MTSDCLAHQVRLAQRDCLGLRRYPTLEHQKLDWNGRDEVCRKILQQVSEELRREGVEPQRAGSRGDGGGGGDGCGGGDGGGGGPSRTTPVRIFQLMGQDSFEDAGGVAAFNNPNTRKYMQGRTILLFPRTTAPSPIHVPPELSSSGLDVQVAAGYLDPVPGLSSTRLRARLTALCRGAQLGAPPEGIHGAQLGAPPEGIHESVWRLAVARRLYAPLAPSARRVLIGVLGAPGSGKTTLCSAMAQRFCGVRHLSGGDFHRAACEELGERYGEGRSLQRVARRDGPIEDELSHFIYSCQVEALRQLETAGYEVVLIDVKDVSQLLILESACLSAFESVPPPPPSAPPSPDLTKSAASSSTPPNTAPVARPIAFDAVLVLNCERATLLARLKGRGEREGDWYGEEKRLDKWFGGDMGVRADQLKSYTSARALTKVRTSEDL